MDKSKTIITIEQYLRALSHHKTKHVAVIRSHPKGNKILEDLYELHRSPKFPKEMSINGEILDNPVYDRLSNEKIDTLVDEYGISNGLNYRLMPEDLYLVKTLDRKGQSILLQYYSGTQLNGWDTWLFPHGYQIHEPDLEKRLHLDARDFEQLIGLEKGESNIQYMPNYEYLLSFKPDFGYKDKLVAYCFMFCSVSITERSKLSDNSFVVKKGEHSRQFKWFYPEELQNDELILNKNADLIRGVHTLYGTSLVPIPTSLNWASQPLSTDSTQITQPKPSVHISGGNFYNSPIGIGDSVNQNSCNIGRLPQEGRSLTQDKSKD